MGAINGRVIYSPKGKAGEYAENAANFFVGCSNGCTYCYLRKGRGAKVFPPGMYDRAIGIIKLSYPFVDLYKIGLQSGGKYQKREIRLIYDTITGHWEGRPEQPRIYWKDSIVNPLGIDRGELPGYCVPVNWDLFNNEK